ncbi:fibronectin type III domain-containing protein [Chryseobacterium geocarposphaerae]|uniref:Putative secreted protein (Por secretion system target) n=1 Tax=Chryseobacterium geocarposphaerae TaxID=1416776 RepID=A0A2M9CBD2_9FLAO|nr:fibronectin type III domain-containing protein [Chryseobacterium geocarposphaerae]PJJ68166.1 putative secreted protein (Por secretion system target) [Chryseobacterium geocarposphaerae]
MKKILLLFSFVIALITNAQVSSYSFVKSSGTYTALTGATTLETATANTLAGSLDNNVYPVTIPFNFSFNGVNYSSLNVSTNGFLTFGTTAPSTSEYSPISNTGAYSGAVSAFGGDLNSVFNLGGTTGNISWGVVGTAPNREIVVQWADFRPSYTLSTTNAYSFSFQIRLRETTNTIAVVYKNGSYLVGSTSISGTRQIGLRGTTNADFNNRTNSTSVLFTNSTAGTANSNTQAYNTTAATPGMPTAGLTYTWTPPTCFAPTNLTSSAITATSGSVSWTAPSLAPGSGYDIYYTTSTTAPTSATVPSQTVPTGTSATISPLTPNTTYYVWVRSKCSGTDQSAWTSTSFTTPCTAITALPWTENFDSMSSIGSGIVPSCWKQIAGTYSWNSSNTASTTYNVPRSTPNYMRIQYGNTTASQLWTPGFALTAGTAYEFSFYYNTGGQGSSYQGFTGNVLVNSATSMTGATNLGTFITATQDTSGYVKYKVYYTPATSGTYYFAANVSANGSPWYLGLDDFKLRVAPTCIEPLGVTVVGSTSSTATISWTPPTTAPAGGYQIYYSTTTTPPATPNITGIPSGSTGYTIPGLAQSTTYYIWVKALCSSTDQSDLSDVVSVMTTQIPATLPYIQNFETANDLGLINGTQTNKWFYGSATGNTGKSIYITNDNGVTNAYNITAGSVVQAYRDIEIPTGTSLATFSFDWKAQGESSSFDYLRVWLVPSNFMPTPGTRIVAGTGRVQIGQYNLNGTTWSTYSNANLNLTSYAGGIMRVVFEWYNDTSGGTQPPAAVDNIVLRVCSNATPVVTVVPTSITHNSATITWPQDIGGASYKVRYRPVGSTQWLPTAGPIDVAAITGTTQTFTLNPPTYPLTPATDYEVEVAAVCNTVNVGTYSHNVFTTKCDPTPPNVTFTNITSTSAVINWSPLVASATYQMQWRKVGDIGWSATINLPNPPTNNYLLSGLSPYTQYEVQVRSTCVGSTTPNPWSSLARFTTERTCDIAPPGLTILELKPTSAKVQWDPYVGPDATGKYILRYRKVGIPGWTNIQVSNNIYTLTGLTELTKYEMEVANICSGTPGNFTLPYYFTTPTVIYCQMGALNPSGEYISKVTVVPNGKPQMIKASAGSTYTDYTTDPLAQIELIQGSVNNQLTIDKVVSADAGVVAWIDFDRNGEFDINERILVSNPSTAATATTTFSVPSDAFVSNADYMYVVMRVALMKGGIPVNCTNFDSGEVEDYTVRISKKPATNLLNQNDILIYPNPVSTVLNVKNISKRANYKIYSAAGQLIASGIILNNKVDVHTLINGVYMIDIQDGSTSVQKKFIKE